MKIDVSRRSDIWIIGPENIVSKKSRPMSRVASVSFNYTRADGTYNRTGITRAQQQRMLQRSPGSSFEGECPGLSLLLIT